MQATIRTPEPSKSALNARPPATWTTTPAFALSVGILRLRAIVQILSARCEVTGVRCLLKPVRGSVEKLHSGQVALCSVGLRFLGCYCMRRVLQQRTNIRHRIFTTNSKTPVHVSRSNETPPTNRNSMGDTHTNQNKKLLPAVAPSIARSPRRSHATALVDNAPV